MGREPLGEAVGADEVGEVAAQLVVGVVVDRLTVASLMVRFIRSTCRWSRDAWAWSGDDRYRCGRRPRRRHELAAASTFSGDETHHVAAHSLRRATCLVGRI